MFLALIAVLACPGAAFAHSIERNTSFMRLDLDADAVLAVEVKRPFSLNKGALLEVLDVFRAPKDIVKGAVLETADRIRGVNDGTYGEGVCFAFLKRHNGAWYTVMGNYLSHTRKRADVDADHQYNFLGSLVTAKQIQDALDAHKELAPAHARFVKAGAQPADTPLADERPPVYRRWLASGNPLLGVSALVDAYEIADEAKPLFGGNPRPLPQDFIDELSAVAVDGLKHDNQWVQSAALAILERVGVPQDAHDALSRIARLKPGEHLTIVRQETYRYFGTVPKLAESDLQLLMTGLLDPSLADPVNDFAAEGVRNAAKRPENVPALVATLKLMFMEKDAASQLAAARAAQSIGTDEAYTLLFEALTSARTPAIRDEYVRRLAGWANKLNLNNLCALVDQDRAESYLGSDATLALDSLIAVGGDAAKSYVSKLSVERKEDPQILGTMAALGSQASLVRLLELVVRDGEMRAMDYGVMALERFPKTTGLDAATLQALYTTLDKASNTGFRQELLEVWLRRKDEFERQEDIGLVMVKAQATVEALVFLRAIDGEMPLNALERCITEGAAERRATAIEYAERIGLVALLPAIRAVEAGDEWLLAYRRASALAHLDKDDRGSALAAFFHNVPLGLYIETPFGRSPLEDSLNRPECLPLIRRLIEEGIVAPERDPLGRASSATRLLSRLTGHYDGYAAALGLDARAVARVKKRWQEWYDVSKDKLVWDASLGRFDAR